MLPLNLFLFSSKRESPYKSTSFLILSENELKFSEIDFTLFIRTIRFWEKWWQCISIYNVLSISKLQEDEGFWQSWKLWWNLCSLRWLKPKRKRVRSFNPIGSNTLYTLRGTEWMNDSSLLLKIAINSEFLIVTSNLDQSLKVEGKNNFWNSLFDSGMLVHGWSLP